MRVGGVMGMRVGGVMGVPAAGVRGVEQEPSGMSMRRLLALLMAAGAKNF